MLINSNRFCADCSDPCAVNVNLTHFTFICSSCAIVHRQLNHTVRNAAIDTFTPEEIETLTSATNGDVNQIWLARHSPGDCTITHESEPPERRHFLECKYILKKWYSPLLGACQTPDIQDTVCSSDFSTEQSDIGSPIPPFNCQEVLGPMFLAEQIDLERVQYDSLPKQIGRQPPPMSWQMRQPALQRKQRQWAMPQDKK
jgi:hypothetical protein